MRFRTSFVVALFGVLALFGAPALAIINQVDGVIVPQNDVLQACLDKRADLILGVLLRPLRGRRKRKAIRPAQSSACRQRGSKAQDSAPAPVRATALHPAR